jgi:hypothetical protein
MTARKKIILGFALIAFVDIVLWELWRSRIPDPIYQGKHLSYWLAHTPAPAPFLGPDGPILVVHVEETPVGHVGTNAIPLLLAYMGAHDSRIKTAMIKWMRSRRFVSFVRFGELYTDGELHSQALPGFQVLGSIGLGQSAVPELMRIYKINPSYPSQAFVVQALGSIGPGAKDSIPLLIGATTNSDYRLRRCGLRALGQISCEPDVIVPVLTNALNDSDRTIQITAAQSIGNFGLHARAAFPPLLQLWQSASERRGSFTIGGEIAADNFAYVLKQIDPEAAAKAGIQ